jgi:hypothetical protein
MDTPGHVVKQKQVEQIFGVSFSPMIMKRQSIIMDLLYFQSLV